MRPPARLFLSGEGTPPEPTPEPAYKSGRQGPALVSPNRSRHPDPQNRGPGFACLPLVGGEENRTTQNAPRRKFTLSPSFPSPDFLKNRSWSILDVFAAVPLALRNLSPGFFRSRVFLRERCAASARPDLHRFRGKPSLPARRRLPFARLSPLCSRSVQPGPSPSSFGT